jgi:hypothetical protein
VPRWVDFPDWGDATATRLYEALSRQVSDAGSIRDIWVQAGMSDADQYWGQSARQLWRSLLRDAHREGHLADLIEIVRASTPGLRAELGSVLMRTVEGPAWYATHDRFLARLVGPGGCYAVLDRSELRSGMTRLVRQNFPILSVNGLRGTGRSFTGIFLQHLAADQTIGNYRVIDVTEDWQEAPAAPEYMRVLCNRLGVPPVEVLDPHTEGTHVARELVDQLVGRSSQIDPNVRWLFLDGLDRAGKEVRDLVGHLARQIVLEQLGPLHLIITGHSNDFAPRVLDVLVTEQLQPLTREHVAEFFTDVAKHIGRADVDVEELVNEALTDGTLQNLRMLGRAVREIAHREFGGGR